MRAVYLLFIATIYLNASSNFDILNEPLFKIDNKAVTSIGLFKFMLVFIIGFSLASFYKKKITLITKNRLNLSSSSQTIIANIGNYLILIVTIIVALNYLGIDLSSLAFIAGALSVGIGFGLQNLVSNFISGIILMFEKTIRIGDLIELANEKGRVSEIRIRSTTITTFDNIDVIVPNSTLMQNSVINWTLRDPIRRLQIPFSVSYGTTVENVENTILEELKNSNLSYINEMEKTPQVWMSAMGASSVDYLLMIWVDTDDSTSSGKSDFLKFIYRTLYKNQIEIPFPQMDIHIKSSELIK